MNRLWYCVFVYIVNAGSYNSKIKSLENTVQKCNRVIESRNGEMSGTIISPGYPSDYPSSMVCKYIFKGDGQQRVQIKFIDMNLHYTGRGAPSDPFQCSDQGDTISVIIYIKEERKELGEYCGQKKPPVLMSSGVRMEVIFKSDSKMKSGVSGFKFEYSFRTDFGVQGNGVQDSREGCTFKYNSSAAASGEFTSPNYPGFYPRSCICKYYFYGQKLERVNISFETFSLDKMNGCTGGDESDSLSFSNYWNSEDRKMPRYCGLILPEMVQSDSSFFLVTFRSNDIFDATGFKANYTFISTQEKDDPEPQPTTQDDSSDASSFSAPAFLLTLISCTILLIKNL